MSDATQTDGAKIVSVKKKRGLKFWLGATVFILILLPVILLLGVWAYVNFGFLNSTLEARITKKMGAPARVGAVKTSVLGGMNLEAISVEARDKGTPLTVGATSVEWDFFDLLGGRLRAVKIDRPSVDLRHDPATGWNFKLTPSSGSEGTIKIGRFDLTNGTFSSVLPGGGNVSLTNLRGNYTDMDGRGLNPFLLRAELNAREPWVIEGSTAKDGKTFSVHGFGAVDFERDFPGAAMNGRGRVAISAQRPVESDPLRVNASVTGMEHLPPLDAVVVLKGSALNASIVLGKFITATLQILDVQNAAVEQMKVQNFNFDVGRFLESDVGLRLLSKTSNAEAPPLAGAMPYTFSGAFVAPLMEVAQNGTVSGLQARELAVLRWPFKIAAPTWKLSGPVTPSFEKKGDVYSAISVGAEFKSPGVKVGIDALSMSLSSRFARNEKGVWEPGSVEVVTLRTSLEELEKQFGFLTGSGVTVLGGVEISRAVFNPATGEGRGIFKLTGAEINLPVPENLRALAADGLRAMGQNMAASVLQQLGVGEQVKISAINAEIGFEMVKGKVTIKGDIRPAHISVNLPVVGDFRVAQTPEISLIDIITPGAIGASRHDFMLDDKLLAHGWGRATHNGAGQWEIMLQGALEKGALKVGSIQATFDEDKHTAGPIKIGVDFIDLATLGPAWSAGEPGRMWSGSLDNPEVEIAPFSFAGAGIPNIEAKVTGSFSDVKFDLKGQNFEQLNGPVTVRVNAGKLGVNVDAQATFDKYAGTFGNKAFVVPAPGANETAALKVAFSIPKQSTPGMTVRVDKVGLDVENRFKMSAEGVITRDWAGVWRSAEFANVTLLVNDLATLSGAWGPANFKNRATWWSGAKWAGRAYYSGAARWDVEEKFGLNGVLKLENAVLPANAETPQATENFSSESPVSARFQIKDGTILLKPKQVVEPDVPAGWGDVLKGVRGVKRP